MNNFIITQTIDGLDENWRALIQRASDAASHAYAPYSNFCVGAAILTDHDAIITGTNQENAAYPSGMCAERVALFTVAAQNPNPFIQKIAVVAKRKSENLLVPATCCGSCRQVILEFESRQSTPIAIVMMGNDGEWITAPSAASLLPFAFYPKNLNR